MRRSTKFLLIIIFLLALVVRFWKLGVYPEALDEDEMAAGYYGFSLLNKGTDEYGQRFPLYFKSVGDYKYGLLFYLETIPVGLFGLNPFATRSVSALAGSLSVVVLFYLAYLLFAKEEYGLLAAAVLAFNPTHIHFSRVAYSTIVGGFWALLAITFFFTWIKKKKLKFGLLSFGFFLLAIFTYQTYRVFLPLVFLFVLVSFWSRLEKKRIQTSLFALLAVFVVGLSLLNPAARARAQTPTQLVNLPNLLEQLAEDGLAGSPIWLSRVFHNKVSSALLGMAGRYLEYYNPRFLFNEASAEATRQTTPGVGLFHLIDAPLFLLGLIFLGKLIRGTEKSSFLILILAAPMAAVLTLDPLSLTRAAVLVYGLVLLVALGGYVLIFRSGKYRRVIGAVFGVLYLAGFAYFWHQYTVQKVYHHPWYSDVGLKEMVQEVNRLTPAYQNVVIAEGHYFPFLFYNRVLPEALTIKGGRVDAFGKIIFGMPTCPAAGKKNVLYVCFGYQIPAKAKLISAIRYRDGQPALILIEFSGTASLEKLPERLKYSDALDSRFPEGLLPDDYATFWPAQK